MQKPDSLHTPLGFRDLGMFGVFGLGLGPILYAENNIELRLDPPQFLNPKPLPRVGGCRTLGVGTFASLLFLPSPKVEHCLKSCLAKHLAAWNGVPRPLAACWVGTCALAEVWR